MKTAISIPDPEFEAAEKLAAHLGLSRSELYRKALAAFVAQYSNEDITARINAVLSTDTEDTDLDNELLQLQENSISKEDW